MAAGDPHIEDAVAQELRDTLSLANVCVDRVEGTNVSSPSPFHTVVTLKVLLGTQDQAPRLLSALDHEYNWLSHTLTLQGLTYHVTHAQMYADLEDGSLPIDCVNNDFCTTVGWKCDKKKDKGFVCHDPLGQRELYPHGSTTGDQQLSQVGWRTVSEPIFFTSGLVFGSERHTVAHIQANGVVTFGEKKGAFTPDFTTAADSDLRVLAVFWSDIDPYQHPQVFYHVYELVNSDGQVASEHDRTVMDRASGEVREFAHVDNFQASVVLVVTWVKVQPYTWRSEICANRTGVSLTATQCETPEGMEENTFQAVYASDGQDAYVIYTYRRHDMRWRYVTNRQIAVGLVSDANRMDLLGNNLRLASRLDTVLGSAGVRGTFLLHAGHVARASPFHQCARFYADNLPLLTNDSFTSDVNTLLDCPCSQARMGSQWTLVRRQGEDEDAVTCFAINPAVREKFFPGNYLNKLCCYNRPSTQSSLLTAGDEAYFLSSGPSSGHILTVDPFWWHGDPRRSEEEDMMPHRWCCEQADETHCRFYYKVRPRTPCRATAGYTSGWSWGDPHITTLDGRQYTLNGWGEFVLIHIPRENFTLQARTAPAETAEGKVTNATVFVAFACRQGEHTHLQVELSRNRASMLIAANQDGVSTQFNDVTRSFQRSFSSGHLMVTREERNGGSSSVLVASFSSGVRVKINVGVRSLELTTDVLNSLSGQLEGLLGNYNHNDTDDFHLPGGTMLPNNMTDRQIFQKFGQAWAITASTSVFEYSDLENFPDFQHGNFTPTFLDEVDDKRKKEAEQACGGSRDVACVFDLLTTGDQLFADNTKLSNQRSVRTKRETENGLPSVTIPGALNDDLWFNVTLGQPLTLTLNGSDPDGDLLGFRLMGDHPDVMVDNATGKVTFPADFDYANVSTVGIIAEDDRGGQSSVADVTFIVCSGCNGHGVCSSRIQEAYGNRNRLYRFYFCECLPGYTGVDCADDRDGCLGAPCSVGQNCSDVTAVNEERTGKGYTCGPCPAGYTDQSEICTDINECNNATLNACAHNCTNTQGSYSCSCAQGYVLADDGKNCRDINECEDRTAECQQSCLNHGGGYSCGCQDGYNLASDKLSCVLDQSYDAICNRTGCQQICRVDNNTKNATCDCMTGYTLKSDNVSCENIDECALAKPPCDQNCTDTLGDFICDCYTGYQLLDKVTCTECEDGYYGDSCKQQCNCNGHGDCDKIKGCVCSSGWRGPGCQEDIDECSDGGSRSPCADRELCVNTPGSYLCTCPKGYFRSEGNSGCVDVNECAEITDNTCDVILEQCHNIEGSYSCNCKPGYARNLTSHLCEDVDECATGSNNCEQLCENVPGQFNCKCRYGMKLADDRRTCYEVWDVCSEFENLNCSHGCTVDLKTEVAQCFCHWGYRLMGLEQCADVNECTDEKLNHCSYTPGCRNTKGGYTCSCELGQKLDNDLRTCIDCPKGTWGDNCSNACACTENTEECSPQKGCVCEKGFTGKYCEKDINECETGDLVCGSLETCRNTRGNASCECTQGYHRVKGLCEDIDECNSRLTNDCDQVCNNVEGNYSCSCFKGFLYNSNLRLCLDIDECSSKVRRCDQNCVNTLGGFRCSCEPGFRLDSDAFSCIGKTQCSPGHNCSGTCVFIDNQNRCYCPRGKKLSQDNHTCEDVDLCNPNPCSDHCEETHNDQDFVCTCPNGTKLADDRVSCQECPPFKWGHECVSECLCLAPNTRKCVPENGTCICLDGWEGDNCTQDVDECSADPDVCADIGHSQCVNSDGGYQCRCLSGFYKLNETTCQECADNWFGASCAQSCTCNSAHSRCDEVNGTCYCHHGWHGDDCSEDDDECSMASGNNCNVTDHEECSNTAGGYVCVCLDGFFRPEPNAKCQACVPGSFGRDCTQVCTCMPGNSESCDHINGTCVCRPGWTGQSCETDVDECLQGADQCPANSQCRNQNGTYSCECDGGLSRDSQSGQCRNVNECLGSDVPVCAQVCQDTYGSYKCSCRDGFSISATNTSRCDKVINFAVTLEYNTTGIDLLPGNPDYQRLTESLNQTMSKQAANFVPGLASLSVKALSGENGQVRADFQLLLEDSRGRHFGSAVARMLTHLLSQPVEVGGVNVSAASARVAEDEFDQCASLCGKTELITPCSTREMCVQDGDSTDCVPSATWVSYNFTLTFNVSLPAKAFSSAHDGGCLTLSEQLQTQVHDKMSSYIQELAEPEILSLTQGSLIAQVKTVINQDLNPNPAGSLSQALVSLSSSPFNISDQQQVPVAMLQVGENIIDGNSDPCHILTSLTACPGDQTCVVNASLPVCRKVEPVNDSQLLLGLAVGLPLFALLLLAVAMATYYYRGKQKEQKKVSGMPQELEFPSSLSPKDIDVRMLRPAVRHSLRYYGEAPGMYHKGEEPTISHHRSSAPVLTEHTDAQMYEHIDSRGNALRCARPDVRGDNFLEELEDAIYARPNVYRAHAPVDDASRAAVEEERVKRLSNMLEGTELANEASFRIHRPRVSETSTEL